MEKRDQLTEKILIALYLLLILYITIVNRYSTILSQVAPNPFWSYLLAFKGNWNLALEILENILLFVPLGFSVKQLGWKKRWIVIGCLGFSVFIEVIQLIFHLGLFEFDDILDNTLGAFLGAVICEKLKISDAKKILLSVSIVLCSLVYCFVMPKSEGTAPEREFYYGIKSCEIANEDLTLDGYCFIYDKPEEEYTVFLESDKDKIQLNLTTSLPSEDINTYYLCDKDYSNTGFTATADIDTTATYEIKVKWDNGITTSTNTYVKNGEIVYSLSDAPDYPATLLVPEPGRDFYVYQDGGNLYWLCGDNFHFEDDCSTYIQYQLWTTQTDNLPSPRLENNWLWDNIGFSFEDYEIESWNGYRVARKALPTEYSITAIVTGYYKDGKWIWKDYFRPIVFDIPGFPDVREENCES